MENLEKYILPVAKTIAIVSPTLYAGVTFAYSHIVLPPLLTHASPKMLAKQWLQAYQLGPSFVPPLVVSGTLCNAFLAYSTFSLTSKIPRTLYVFAAIASISIVPFTKLYMEPGVNGAAKWKAQGLLKGEVKLGKVGNTGVRKDTAMEKSKKWADSVEMKDLVRSWGETNAVRWMITLAGAVASGLASNYVFS